MTPILVGWICHHRNNTIDPRTDQCYHNGIASMSHLMGVKDRGRSYVVLIQLVCNQKVLALVPKLEGFELIQSKQRDWGQYYIFSFIAIMLLGSLKMKLCDLWCHGDDNTFVVTQNTTNVAFIKLHWHGTLKVVEAFDFFSIELMSSYACEYMEPQVQSEPGWCGQGHHKGIANNLHTKAVILRATRPVIAMTSGEAIVRHDVISDITFVFCIMDQVTGKRCDLPIGNNGQERALQPSNRPHCESFNKTVETTPWLQTFYYFLKGLNPSKHIPIELVTKVVTSCVAEVRVDPTLFENIFLVIKVPTICPPNTCTYTSLLGIVGFWWVFGDTFISVPRRATSHGGDVSLLFLPVRSRRRLNVLFRRASSRDYCFASGR